MFALVCQCGSREAAQQRAEGLIRGLDGYLAGFRAEYAGAFRAGICSLEENPDYSGEAALYSARQGCGEGGAWRCREGGVNPALQRRGPLDVGAGRGSDTRLGGGGDKIGQNPPTVSNY